MTVPFPVTVGLSASLFCCIGCSLPPFHTAGANMARIVRTYRKYWPTDAVLRGKVVLEDLMLCSFSSKELTEGWAVTTDQRWGGK